MTVTPHLFDQVIAVSDKGTWASHIPWRSPSWKVHTQKAHAASAVGRVSLNQAWAIYKLDGDHWVRLYQNDLDDTCVRCGGSHKQAFQAVWGSEPRYGSQTRYYDPQDDRPKYQREIICAVCNQRASQ